MKKKSPVDRKRVAHHEAGHALVAYLVFGPHESPLKEISIRQSESFQGHVRWAEDFDRGEDRECIEKELTTLLGGTIAEEIIYQDSKGGKADEIEVKDLLQGLDWLEDKSADGKEVIAYLGWLRLRTWNKSKITLAGKYWKSWQGECWKKKTLSYTEAKRIIDEVIQARPNHALEATKRKLNKGKRIDDSDSLP